MRKEGKARKELGTERKGLQGSEGVESGDKKEILQTEKRERERG